MRDGAAEYLVPEDEHAMKKKKNFLFSKKNKQNTKLPVLEASRIREQEVLYSVAELQESLQSVILRNIPNITRVLQVDVHFLPPIGSNKIHAEIVICSDLRLLSEIREQAEAIRKLVLTQLTRCDDCNIKCADVANVEVRLELSDGCHLISKELEL